MPRPLPIVLRAGPVGLRFPPARCAAAAAGPRAAAGQSPDPYSPLAESLSEALSRAGATPAAETPRRHQLRRHHGAGRERRHPAIRSERWGDTPLSVDQRGRAQEYTLRYAVFFRLTRADGSDLVPQQAVELSRDYISTPTNSSGTEGEREILASEMRREMVASILRRIDAAARAPVQPRPGRTIHAGVRATLCRHPPRLTMEVRLRSGWRRTSRGAAASGLACRRPGTLLRPRSGRRHPRRRARAGHHRARGVRGRGQIASRTGKRWKPASARPGLFAQRRLRRTAAAHRKARREGRRGDHRVLRRSARRCLPAGHVRANGAGSTAANGARRSARSAIVVNAWAVKPHELAGLDRPAPAQQGPARRPRRGAAAGRTRRRQPAGRGAGNRQARAAQPTAAHRCRAHGCPGGRCRALRRVPPGRCGDERPAAPGVAHAAPACAPKAKRCRRCSAWW